jgi:hypothetical protein
MDDDLKQFSQVKGLARAPLAQMRETLRRDYGGRTIGSWAPLACSSTLPTSKVSKCRERSRSDRVVRSCGERDVIKACGAVEPPEARSCDPSPWHLLNLLSNAVKFTQEGGQVGLTATPAEGGITIAVSDTGIGIVPEDQAAIFEEFRQVGRDHPRTQEGTGLGLTLAKKTRRRGLEQRAYAEGKKKCPFCAEDDSGRREGMPLLRSRFADARDCSA